MKADAKLRRRDRVDKRVTSDVVESKESGQEKRQRPGKSGSRQQWVRLGEYVRAGRMRCRDAKTFSILLFCSLERKACIALQCGACSALPSEGSSGTRPPAAEVVDFGLVLFPEAVAAAGPSLELTIQVPPRVHVPSGGCCVCLCAMRQNSFGPVGHRTWVRVRVGIRIRLRLGRFPIAKAGDTSTTRKKTRDARLSARVTADAFTA